MMFLHLLISKKSITVLRAKVINAGNDLSFQGEKKHAFLCVCVVGGEREKGHSENKLPSISMTVAVFISTSLYNPHIQARTCSHTHVYGYVSFWMCVHVQAEK